MQRDSKVYFGFEIFHFQFFIRRVDFNIKMVLAVNRAIGEMPFLDVFLADYPSAVFGWGRKRSGNVARMVAKLLHRPCVLLEDGFIRSVERRGAVVSLIVDDIGVYYDATAPSRVEREISSVLTKEKYARAETLIENWKRSQISKYNHNPEYVGELPRSYVLVVDQTRGDLSIKKGKASRDTFSMMLKAALAEHPDSTIVVKAHPDSRTHAKLGNFEESDLHHPRVHLIAIECHPVRLLAHAEAVYTVTSLIGFEALLWNKPVRCFGMPFYAGWGLTNDALPAPGRRGRTDLPNLAYAALIECARYVDPETGKLWEVEQAIEYVVAGRAKLLNKLQ